MLWSESQRNGGIRGYAARSGDGSRQMSEISDEGHAISKANERMIEYGGQPSEGGHDVTTEMSNTGYGRLPTPIALPSQCMPRPYWRQFQNSVTLLIVFP